MNDLDVKFQIDMWGYAVRGEYDFIANVAECAGTLEEAWDRPRESLDHTFIVNEKGEYSKPPEYWRLPYLMDHAMRYNLEEEVL